MNCVRAAGRDRTAGCIDRSGRITKNDDAATTRAARLSGVAAAAAATVTLVGRPGSTGRTGIVITAGAARRIRDRSPRE